MSTLLLALALPALGRDAPRYPDAVHVLLADAIVVAKVTSVEPVGRYVATTVLDVQRVLTGDLEPGPLTADLEHRFAPEDRALVHLARRGDGWVGLAGGTAPYTPPLETQRKRQLANRAPWSETRGGWKAALALDPAEARVGQHIDAWVVFRNTSSSAQTLEYAEWPPEAHTHWTLQITRDGGPIEPKPHPHVSPAEIEQHFSAHGHAFELEVGPGEAFPLVLTRIESAEPGWGYKQRLGFRYWPLEEAGTYAVGAVEAGFEGREPLVLPPAQLVLR